VQAKLQEEVPVKQPSATPQNETSPLMVAETVQNEERSVSLQPFYWQEDATQSSASDYANEYEKQEASLTPEIAAPNATIATSTVNEEGATEEVPREEMPVRPAMVTENIAPVVIKCAHHDHYQHHDVDHNHYHHRHRHHHHHFFHSPRLEKGCNLFLTNEYLYWTTKEPGLAYGMYFQSSQAPEPSTPFEVLYGKTKHINPHMRLGYRNSVRYEFPDTRWDLNAVWTSYHNSKDSEFLPHNNLFFATFFLNKNFNPVGRGAKAHWDLDFNAVDLEAAYTTRLGSSFSLRAFMGLKAALIKQDIHVDYLQVIFLGSLPTPSVDIASQNKYHSHNYGLRMGFNSQYHLADGFKLFVNGAVAVVWSSFNIMHVERAAGYPLRVKRRDSFEAINPELEVAAGIAWQKNFCHRRYFLDLRLGWEQQVWIAQNQFNQMASAFAFDQVIAQSVNMAFSGPTFSATFGF
jgi:hypothetical protein